jgi:hypothetical protein
MKTKFGAIVTDGRGKLAGHVFKQSRSGGVMQTKTSPLQKKTSAMLSHRLLMASLSNSWNALTQEQRDSWNEQGNIIGAGFNDYMSKNLNLSIGNLPLRNTPLNSEELIPYNLLTINKSNSPSALFLNIQFNTMVGITWLLYATPVMRNGVTVSEKNFKFIGSGVWSSTVLVISSLYNSRYGSLPSSGKFYIGWRVLYPSGKVTSFEHRLVTYTA